MTEPEVKILIAEDERPLRLALQVQISKVWPEATIVATCADGDEAIKEFERHAPNVVFLDIRMPGKSGLDVARLVSNRAFVVFTTAYDEYAVTAFESGALDYLMKPIETVRLSETVARLKQRLSDQVPQDLELLITQLQDKLTRKSDTLKWVTASIGDTVKMIAVDEILYFQSEDKYTKVVTSGFDAIIRMPLKGLMQRLDSELFWQVHRSVIVSAEAIDSIVKNELGVWQLHLRNREECLPVSSDFHRKLKSM
jgi:DNA-binding LytR/AlgR family response regulator